MTTLTVQHIPCLNLFRKKYSVDIGGTKFTLMIPRRTDSNELLLKLFCSFVSYDYIQLLQDYTLATECDEGVSKLVQGAMDYAKLKIA